MAFSTLAYRYLGIFECSRKHLRSRWVEITWESGLALALIKWGSSPHYSIHVHLGWPNIFLRLPIRPKTEVPIGEMSETWGFSLFEREVHLNWGAKCKIVYLPWAYDWVRTSYLLPDETWAHDLRSDRAARGLERYRHFADMPKWEQQHPYIYKLRSGEIQERVATIQVQESEHRQRWLMWCPWFARVSRGIDVRFDGEVGERSGSWKGGVIGCGYDMRRGEKPVDALRRMERERTFG